MHEEVLAPETARVFSRLNTATWMSSYYLGGGTAVALLLGHRRSDDLDFFLEGTLHTLELRQSLARFAPFQLDAESVGTVHGRLSGVRVSFLEYRYPLLKPCKRLQGVAIASLQDLACMKLEAIAARGKKRDLVDLYAIAQEGYSLKEILLWFETKYRPLQYNPMHLIKSLTYFEDAEGDPTPILLEKIDWSAVKNYFKREARRLVP